MITSLLYINTAFSANRSGGRVEPFYDRDDNNGTTNNEVYGGGEYYGPVLVAPNNAFPDDTESNDLYDYYLQQDLGGQ